MLLWECDGICPIIGNFKEDCNYSLIALMYLSADRFTAFLASCT